MTNVPPTPLSLIETEGLKNRVIRHTSELIRLAGPIVVSRSGLLLLALADTVMTGRYNTAELAYLSIGMGVLMPLLITAIGMIMGTLVLTANAFGGERYEECGAYLAAIYFLCPFDRDWLRGRGIVWRTFDAAVGATC